MTGHDYRIVRRPRGEHDYGPAIGLGVVLFGSLLMWGLIWFAIFKVAQSW